MKNTTLLFALILFNTSVALAAPGGNGVVPRTNWVDSYSANGRCYIDSNFDHGIGSKRVDTPIGPQTVRQVAAKLGKGPGRAGNPIYNDVQCGNGPANNAGDEDYDQCPGRVDQGAAGCSVIGPKWDLKTAYATSGSTTTTNTTTTSNTNTTSATTAGNSSAGCTATGSTIQNAIAAFNQQCAGQKRVDCDPLVVDNKNQWMCASFNITNGSVPKPQPVSTSKPTPEPTPAPAPAKPQSNASTTTVAGRCDALGATLGAARQAYAQKCSARRVDCDPTGNKTEYLCASYNIVGKPRPTIPAAEPATKPVAQPAPKPSPTPSKPQADNSAKCEAFGANLVLARKAYAKKCTLPRQDCDPVSGGYVCASYKMGSNGSVPAPSANPAPAPASPAPSTPAPASPVPASPAPSNNGRCDAFGADIRAAHAAYAAKCSLPRKDCDPVSGGFVCASYNIGSAGPQSSPTQPSSAPAPTAGTIRIQAESQVGAGWVRKGSYIEFTGANTYASPTFGTLVYNVRIPAAGDWEMRWRAKAAKQTPGRSDLHNDAWVKMNGQTIGGFHDVRSFRKVFSPGNGQWNVVATAEIGNHNFSKFRQRFTPGNFRFEISGRSNAFAIDYIEFVQINSIGRTQPSNSPAPTTSSGPLDPLGGIGRYLDTFNQPYVNGDLVSLHWDSSMDPDDMQAMILSKEMLDSMPQVDYIAVNGTKRTANSQILPTSTAHMKGLFPSGYEAFRNGLNGTAQRNLYNSTVKTVATSWALTLASGGRVHVAEGGPANFTASVINELRSRNVSVSSLKNIRVIQHSWGWNERNTDGAALNTIRRYAEYIRIADGNLGNGEGADNAATPDYELKNPNDARCVRFRNRALSSRYARQWQEAFRQIRNKCDGSDAVELAWILGIRTNVIPTLQKFADRYF